MAGFWNLSQQQLYDQNGKPMVGAKAYFFLGGTTTPITVYKAFALGAINAHPNPLVTDGFGRWPSIYMDEADQFYRVRVTTAGGVVVLDEDGLPIIGPSGGGGGGGDNPVNPDAVFSTGDLKSRYGEGFISGWVRANGRTIGSTISGASERAAADTQPLFEYLWNTDPNLTVVGGRGATSSADWAANKQITLPDWRGRVILGSDSMGNTSAGVVGGADILGYTVGEALHTLTSNEMPFHNHGVTDPGHAHSLGANVPELVVGSTVNLSGSANSAVISQTQPAFTGISVQGAGGGLAHNNVQPSRVATIYIRL